jgi:hypothetical protein
LETEQDGADRTFGYPTLASRIKYCRQNILYKTSLDHEAESKEVAAKIKSSMVLTPPANSATHQN